MTNKKDEWIEERVREFDSAYMNNGINGVLRDEFQDTRTMLIRAFFQSTLIAHTAHLKEQLLGEMPKREMGGMFQGGYNSAIDDMTAIINKI